MAMVGDHNSGKLHWFILGLIAAPSPSSQLLRLRLEVDQEVTAEGKGRPSEQV